VTAKKDRWEIHYDPYDVSRVWVRDPAGGWIRAVWKHLDRVPTPFGELAWDHVRKGLPEATEAELADAVQALLQRAHQGPAADPATAKKTSRRDKRVAARTRATASTAPAAAIDIGEHQEEQATTESEQTPLAKVIPLPLFDPFAEADKPW
jgi:hypothetical protein